MVGDLDAGVAGHPGLGADAEFGERRVLPGHAGPGAGEDREGLDPAQRQFVAEVEGQQARVVDAELDLLQQRADLDQQGLDLGRGAAQRGPGGGVGALAFGEHGPDGGGERGVQGVVELVGAAGGVERSGDGRSGVVERGGRGGDPLVREVAEFAHRGGVPGVGDGAVGLGGAGLGVGAVGAGLGVVGAGGGGAGPVVGVGGAAFGGGAALLGVGGALFGGAGGVGGAPGGPQQRSCGQGGAGQQGEHDHDHGVLGGCRRRGSGVRRCWRRCRRRAAGRGRPSGRRPPAWRAARCRRGAGTRWQW